MWGTKTRSSSKRSRKGTSTARRWGPHDGSSSQCSGGGSGGQARGGPGVSCPCPLAAQAMSPEQLSCSQSRERKPSKRQATKRWKTEHFRGRLLGSSLDLGQEQGRSEGQVWSRTVTDPFSGFLTSRAGLPKHLGISTKATLMLFLMLLPCVRIQPMPPLPESPPTTPGSQSAHSSMLSYFL